MFLFRLVESLLVKKLKPLDVMTWVELIILWLKKGEVER